MIHLSVLALWAARHLDTGRWLLAGLARDGSEVHAVLAVALACLVAPRLRSFRPHYQGHWLPAAVALGAVAGDLISARWIELRSLEAAWFVVETWGLVGLYMGPVAWRRTAPVALLGLAALPVSHHLDTWVGFPLRRLIAGEVAHLLDLLGVASVQEGTVLQLDGGGADVAGACSGVKSLWSAGVFLASATWSLRRPLDGWWLGIAAILLGLVLVTNGVRVAVVVVLHEVLSAPLLADVVHAPIGLVGFAVACLAAGGLLALRPELPARVEPAAGGHPRWLGAVFVAQLAALTAAAVIPPPTSPPVDAPELPSWASALPLAGLDASFTRERGSRAAKGRLRLGERDAELLLVSSRTAVGQHPPSWCLEGAGWTVAQQVAWTIAGEAVRGARLNRPAGEATAIWWYQAGDRRTPDHGARALAALSDDATWTLVALVVEGELPADHPELADAVVQLRSHLSGDLR